jgi:hypothetical protein
VRLAVIVVSSPARLEVTDRAPAAATVGDRERAGQLAEQVETVARSITDPRQQAHALTAVTPGSRRRR